MLSEIYPGGSPKTGSTYWDQIHEMGVISVAKRLLKRLHDLLEQVTYSNKNPYKMSRSFSYVPKPCHLQ